ncbi:YitT family protein [Companilactobacillus halodurans]|uniref:YitT family protein n=1 Tax=Companilactobacillus halodurans TaxID=2584183 RepID=A0A5P0ZUA9_9LACO|nr:YitT family protein [Companilactobacillus halodurans]MQS76069.1 YitT family protein [Companilactobacillus halodurans]MQS96505.1 YitT family protein [Companilactobacillus halodurans]
MGELDKLIERHQYLSKVSIAFLYSIAVSIAVNMFWTPGGIYGSGVTGAAQLVSTISHRWMPFNISTAVMYFVLNGPLFVLSWRKIDHKFTVFTIIAVALASMMMHLLPPIKITADPLVCAIFGAVANGFGTGMALRNGISTGGIDILGIILRKRTGKSVGTINIMFNIFIVACAGLLFGWVHALYSAVSIFINGQVIDMIYNKDQKLQVMIVTSKPKNVITQIQNEMRRGITIVHDAEGAYKHEEKTILFTVISRSELHDLETAMAKSDPHAFVSVTDTVKVMGRFYQAHIY